MNKKYKPSLLLRICFTIMVFIIIVYCSLKISENNFYFDFNTLFYISGILSGTYGIIYYWSNKINLTEEGIWYSTLFNKTYIKWNRVIRVDYVFYRTCHYHIVLISEDNKKIKISKAVNIPISYYQNLDQLIVDIYEFTSDNVKFNEKLKSKVDIIKNDRMDSDRFFSKIFIIILVACFLVLGVILLLEYLGLK